MHKSYFKNVQSPSACVMVRPHRFRVNPQTAGDNSFQASGKGLDPEQIAVSALKEFDEAVAQLQAQGIKVHVFEDDGSADTPDSVFPNNWFSTHHGGRVALYPMFASNRRRERRFDVLQMLKNHYRVQEITDYSGLEQDNLYLEGTGVMVFDHRERVAYVGKSHRADPILLERFCTTFGYEPIAFETADADGMPIYHTNVMLSICDQYAIICLDMIKEEMRRAEVADRLKQSGREVINISRKQVADFAGNAFELMGERGPILAMSLRALKALRPDQVAQIEKNAVILPLSIPTIEMAGGSVRCMIAGVHLSPRELS